MVLLGTPSHKFGTPLEILAGASCRAGVLPLPIPVRGQNKARAEPLPYMRQLS
jgi:hypothetical protein